MSRGRLAGIDKSLGQKQGAKERASDLLAQKLKASAEKKRDRFSDLDSNPMFKEAALNVGDFRSLSYSQEGNQDEHASRSGASAGSILDENEEIAAVVKIEVVPSFKMDQLEEHVVLAVEGDLKVDVANETSIIQAIQDVDPVLADAEKPNDVLENRPEPKPTGKSAKELPVFLNDVETDYGVKKLARAVPKSGNASSLLKPNWETDFSKDTFEVFKIVHGITGHRYTYLASGYCALYEKARLTGTVTLHLNRILLGEILGTTSSGTVTRFLKKGVELGLFVCQSFTIKSSVAQSGTYVHLYFPWK
jgi:hypothetical protein